MARVPCQGGFAFAALRETTNGSTRISSHSIAPSTYQGRSKSRLKWQSEGEPGAGAMEWYFSEEAPSGERGAVTDVLLQEDRDRNWSGLLQDGADSPAGPSAVSSSQSRR